MKKLKPSEQYECIRILLASRFNLYPQSYSAAGGETSSETGSLFCSVLCRPGVTNRAPANVEPSTK